MLPSKPPVFIQSLAFKMAVGVGLFIILILASTYYVTQTRGREVMVEHASKLNQKIGQTITLNLRARLAAAESLTTALANLAVVLDKDADEFKRIVPFMMDQAGMLQLIAGGGIWPEPGTFVAGVDRRSFFWGRNANGVLAFYDDYNDPDGAGYHHEEWYVPARFLKPGEVYWSKSYLDPYSLEPMVTCTVPMWFGNMQLNNGFQGVATIDLKLTGLSEFMAQQAKPIGGYAFAVDRNNRLLSIPRLEPSKGVDGQFGPNQQKYPTVLELTQVYPEFSGLAKELNQMDEQHLAQVTASHTELLERMSRAILADSYQLNEREAAGIAALFVDRNALGAEARYLSLARDPILNEPVSLSIFAMPDTGWKLIVAMPARYAEQAVAQITEQMLSLLLVLIMLAAIVYAVYFRLAFLAPVSKLRSQIRQLVSHKDHSTRLQVQGADELSQLASWFNLRTAQLSEAVAALKIKNIALDEARADAEQANQSKNMFMASMSHEIRTPMNAIIGMTEVLMRTELQDEQKNFLQIVNTSAQALLSLINEIIDLSKAEANQLDLEQIPFDLRAIVDDCAELISFQAAEKGLELVYFLAPEVERWVLGDPGRIRQIILNLAGNAVKFTSVGRVELWLEESSQEDDFIKLKVTIRDTGIGIPKDAQRKLFQPFTQGDSSTTRKYGGSGLGLAISQRLAGLMGSEINCCSEEGIGTTFSLELRLPLVRCASDESSATGRHPQDADERGPVLIIGSSFHQNEVAERYLTALGYNFIVRDSLPAWLAELDAYPYQNWPQQPIITLCTDLRLLGDLKTLADRIPQSSVECRMIISRARFETIDLSEFRACPAVRLLTQPLKFKMLKAALQALDGVQEQAPESPHTWFSELDTAADLARFAAQRILIVEDNVVNQKVLMLLLKTLGLQADLVSDGVEAVSAVRRQRYDLVLMDWHMPRMDGLRATQLIRAEQGDAGPIIIAVTANAMDGDVESCLTAGMNDYISKPIRRDQLHALLAKWLGAT